LAVYSQLLLGLGASDSVRCARRVQGEPAALGTRRWRTAIIHWIVWWCTGLSNESSVAKSSLSGKVQRCRLKFTGLSGGAPDCPVSQRSTVQRSAVKSAGDTWLASTVERGHRTVRCAPTDAEVQRSSAPEKEGDPHLTAYSGCPVAHRTVR
jgi:hypothetical protein